MKAESFFVAHEPCPKCGSRDNLGVWSDGHKFCFGCRYYVPGERTIWQSSLLDKISKRNNDLDWIVDGCVDNIDPTALKWLMKYGLTLDEIKEHRLMWNHAKRLLVFPVCDSTGVLSCISCRNFGEGGRKYLTYGNKPYTRIGRLDTDATALVEDFVSAIKVGRHVGVIPLLGAHVPDNLVKSLSDERRRVVVWLDLDKARESLRATNRGLAAGGRWRSLVTELDPKEYSDAQIEQFLKNQ